MSPRSATSLLICAALTGCGERPCSSAHLESCPEARAGDSGEPPLPEITTPTTEPSLSPEALAERFAEALALGVPEARRPRDAYLDLMALGDLDCPGDPAQIVGLVLGCTATSGWTYSGVTEYTLSAEDGRESWLLTADAAIDGPSGERWLAGGHVTLGRESAGPDAWYWGSEIQGSWRWDGEPGWLEAGVSAKLQVEGYRDLTTFWLTLDGGLAYGGVELLFDELLIDGSCPSGARGGLNLRDPSGGWFRADFEEDCAVCGALSFEGEPVDAPLCLDFSPLAAAYDALEIP